MKCRNQNRPSAFPAGGYRRRLSMTLVSGSFYVVVYFVMDACLVCWVCFSFQYLAKRLAGKNIPEMTFSCVGWDVKL